MAEVSVIVPIFNGEAYLPRCMASVLEQTYAGYELILVDDGSTDGSGKLCDRYAGADPRIKVIHQRNRGLTAARNEGIYQAEGRYIAFVDADDWIEMDFLELLTEAIKDADADIVISGCIKEKGARQELCKNKLAASVYRDQGLPEFYARMLYDTGFFEFGIQPYRWNKLFKRDILLETIAGCDDRIDDGEDASLVYPYLLRCRTIYVIEACRYHYVQNQASMTAVKKEDFYQNVARLYLYLRQEFLTSEWRELLMPQVDEYFRYMVYLGKPEAYRKLERNRFPFHKIPVNASVILYAAGFLGQEYYRQLKEIPYCRMIWWVDEQAEGGPSQPIVRPGKIDMNAADYVVIAVKDRRLAEEITDTLVERYQVEADKIVWGGE